MRLQITGMPSAAGGVASALGTISGVAARVRLPRPALAEEWLSTSVRERWPDPPAGDGLPAVLIPGFLAGDPSLTRMASWLKTGAFSLVRSGIRWNVDCMEPTVDSIERRLEQKVQETGKRALVVGQSRGGVIGRVLAVRRPDLVGTLVTLGSPLRSQTSVHPRVWPSIGVVGSLGSLGVPGLFSRECIAGDCCRRCRSDLVVRFPEEVRFLSVYSRQDTIVQYDACLDPAAEHFEVSSSHLGMGMDSEVWSLLSAEL